jgi:hypothetical protein
MTLKGVAAVCHGIGHGDSDVLESAWRIVCVPDAVTLKLNTEPLKIIYQCHLHV